MQNTATDETPYDFRPRYNDIFTGWPSAQLQSPGLPSAETKATGQDILSRATSWAVKAMQRHQDPPLLSPLCNHCAQIFSGQRKDSELGGPHVHPLGLSIPQQEHAAVQGCHLCSIRRSQIPEQALPNLSQLSEIKYGYWESGVGNGIAFEYAGSKTASKALTKSVAFKFLRLLVADELAFRENIPVTELSKTFRDAMEVTRRLGICYIWIDSLCIIQDCEEDWRNEAKRMGEVYRGSCCNIAATAAKDGRDGLFRRRTLLEVEPCRIQATWTSSRQEAYFCHNLDIWDIEIDERPLLARAWVTQELNLSRRSLHFGRTQTFWECTQRRACESYPDRIPNFKAAKPSLHPSSLDLDNPFRFYDGRFIAHELWEKIVNLYSHGELTFESKDKLIAVSGLARNLGLPPETYLAGLWRQGLEEQLLWCVLKEGQTTMSTAAGPAVYRAPSWSWASINGPVLVKTPTMLALKHASIEVLDAKTEFVDPSNPFGQVQSGFLRLRCMLARGYLRERIEVMKTNWTFRSKQLAATPFDTSDPDRYQKRQYFGDSHVNVVWDRGEPALDRAYYCMLVNQQFGGCGLVVQPTGRRHGEYERLGYFAILTGAQEDSPARFSELCRKPLEDDHLYESRDSVTEAGIPRYTVRLV